MNFRGIKIRVSKTSKAPGWTRSRPKRDLLIAGTGFLVVLAFCGAFDVAEAWHEFAEAHEDFELDEIPLAATILTGAFAWFAWRRWQESSAGARRSEEAYQALEEELRLRKEIEKGLVAAQHKAEAADRAKSEFLANMSHELRTPLNATIGFADLIEKEVHGPIGNPAYRDYVSNIREAGQHLLAIINNILDLSKVEAGQLELREEVIELPALAETSLKLVTPQAESQNVQLQCSVPETLPPVYGDPRLLSQVLVNLLSNGVKFSEGGKVSLEAAVGRDGACTLRVSDDGIGMTPEGIVRALEPFGQINTALARDHGGTGLGLPLARALVRLHGGTLTIQSVPEWGTTVEVVIPRERVLLADAAPVTALARG